MFIKTFLGPKLKNKNWALTQDKMMKVSPLFLGSKVVLDFLRVSPPPPMGGKTRFWTPCLGRWPVLTPMSLSQFFA